MLFASKLQTEDHSERRDALAKRLRELEVEQEKADREAKRQADAARARRAEAADAARAEVEAHEAKTEREIATTFYSRLRPLAVELVTGEAEAEGAPQPARAIARKFGVAFREIDDRAKRELGTALSDHHLYVLVACAISDGCAAAAASDNAGSGAHVAAASAFAAALRGNAPPPEVEARFRDLEQAACAHARHAFPRPDRVAVLKSCATSAATRSALSGHDDARRRAEHEAAVRINIQASPFRASEGGRQPRVLSNTLEDYERDRSS